MSLNAEILSIGTELLLGEIVNTNAQYLSQQLADLGISVYYQTVVGDNRQRLLKTFGEAFERSNIVITTGGLGSTGDDLTKETGAEFFGKKLVMDEDLLAELKAHFKRSSFEFTKNNEKQALMPEGAQFLKNDHGTAPGCCISENGKMLILLPGPPVEMIPMFENYALPILRDKSDIKFFSKRIKILGVGESKAEMILKDLIDSQTNPTIAPYAASGELAIRVTASAVDEAEADKIMQPIVDEISKRLGSNIFSFDDSSIEEAIVELLKQRGYTVSIAESCTGGLVTGRLVNCPGVSDVLKEASITYSNEAKEKRLGVKAETLEAHGAVSKETAIEMAVGVKNTSGTNVGLSITGVAGPGGGTEEKPVGLVYLGLCINDKTYVKELRYNGDRAKIRNRTVSAALDFLRRGLIDEL
ncbi:MAG: competence/damage-inducible protein A [Defluviitaleaceae bacterium]|nr:competence/damage-inducible protein A [Defluviitaleaceae bacterium]